MTRFPRPHVAIVAMMVSLLSIVPACKSVPTHMEDDIAKAKKEKQSAQKTLDQSENDLAQLDREKRALDREGVALRAKRDRFASIQESLRLFAVKDYAAAMSSAHSILAEAGTLVIDAKQLDDEEDLLMPALEPAQEASLRAVLGAVHVNNGDVSDAIEQCAKAHELDPTHRFARQNLGLAYFQDQQFERSIAIFEKELRDGYRSGSVLFLVAQSHYEVANKTRALGHSSYLNHFEVARVALTDAFLEDPSNKEIRRYAAVIALECGRFDEAIALFRAILGDDPLDHEYLAQLGQCYVSTEEYRKAADQFELIVHIGKADSDTYAVLGDIYRAMRFPGRAAHWFSEARGGSTEGVDANECFDIGYLFKEAKRVAEARRWLEAVPQESDIFFEAQTQLGYLLLDTGDEPQALASLDRARARRPDEGTIHLTVGDRRLDRKELDHAFEAYTKASALDDTAADGFAGLGEVAYEKGDLELAIAQYQKARGRSPDEPRYRSVLKQLEAERDIRKAARETPK